MVCRLNKDDICLGCYRRLDEIGAWGNSSRTYIILFTDSFC
ncbi:MAG: DUF1289 domain-containing protein [bacterium]|nr:DUF1289 domain-containing protein [Gammaproteobacteria bacterium]